MPCWQRREQTVDLGINTDTNILTAALNALNFGATLLRDGSISFAVNGYLPGSFRNGKLTIDERAADRVPAIKAQYAREAFKSASKAFGFNVTQQGEKLVALRRRY